MSNNVTWRQGFPAPARRKKGNQLGGKSSSRYNGGRMYILCILCCSQSLATAGWRGPNTLKLIWPESNQLCTALLSIRRPGIPMRGLFIMWNVRCRITGCRVDRRKCSDITVPKHLHTCHPHRVPGSQFTRPEWLEWPYYIQQSQNIHCHCHPPPEWCWAWPPFLEVLSRLASYGHIM